MSFRTTIYTCGITHKTRFILRHNKGSHSGCLDFLSVDDAFKAIRGVEGETTRQRANERLTRLREADAIAQIKEGI